MPHARLSLTRLEDRLTPATWNNPWPDAAHLTLSFAPDGTPVGGAASNLSALLGRYRTSDWQLAALRAFQTWAVNANINVSLLADGGQRFGTDGAPQGDTRFGDVRLGAVPLPADPDLAQAEPFDAMAGTWAGDVRLNSAASFDLGGRGGYDVYSVLLHEFGHVLGLTHSADPTSVMFEGYTGVRTGLSADDVTRLQAIYGARSPDAFEGGSGNNTIATATRLNLLANGDGSLGLAVSGDVTTAGDRDLYSFQTGLNLGGMTVRLKTSDVSLLTAKVTVFDSSGRVVASAAATDPRSGDLVINLSSVKSLSTYYVAVEAGRQDVFGVGGYTLGIQQMPLVNRLLGGLTGAADTITSSLFDVLANNDLHTNDTFLTATLLPSLATASGSRFDAAYRGSISDSGDRDLYRLTAPQQGTVLTAMAWGVPTRGLLTGDQHLDPHLAVYDAAGHRVAARVLVNDSYSFAVQVTNVTPGASYYVEVKAGDGGTAVGNYFLGVDFGSTASALPTLSAGSLAAGATSGGDVLGVNNGGLFHFVLSADAAVTMTVSNAAGAALFTLRSPGSGDAVSGNVYLGRGTYTVKFAAATAAADYALRGARLSDPEGPQPVDPTEEPSKRPDGDWSYWVGGGPTDTSKGTATDPSGDPYTTT